MDLAKASTAAIATDGNRTTRWCLIWGVIWPWI